MSAAYLRSYLEVVQPADLLPREPADLALLLDLLVQEKAAYELIYELNNRPDWARIPILGMLRLAR